MARIVRRESRKRGLFGWLFFLIFIGFNVFMAFALFSGLSAVSHMPATASDAESAGRAIGATLGFSAILWIWALGAFITGLLAFMTRGKKIIIEETEQ